MELLKAFTYRLSLFLNNSSKISYLGTDILSMSALGLFSFGVNLHLLHFNTGDIWSGSEGGIIKVWPWEAVEKSLSLSPEERHMAALLVERSSVDLRSQVTVNGVCNISSSDIKCLLSDNLRARIWAAGSLSFSLWYVCRTFSAPENFQLLSKEVIIQFLSPNYLHNFKIVGRLAQENLLKFSI